MAKLKSLRAAAGSYGQVAANGIVEVDEPTAKRLRATKRFVDATPADIKAAQKAQKAAMRVQVQGVAPGFSPLPEPATTDRLAALIREGQISRDDARRLAGLQIELAPEEIRNLIQEDADRATAQISELQSALDAREKDLDARAADLDAREQALADREAAGAAAPAEGDAAEDGTGATLGDDAPAADDQPAEPDAKPDAKASRKAGK